MTDVLRGVHLDRRFSPRLPSGERVEPGLLSYLWAGVGFGGAAGISLRGMTGDAGSGSAGSD